MDRSLQEIINEEKIWIQSKCANTYSYRIGKKKEERRKSQHRNKECGKNMERSLKNDRMCRLEGALNSWKVESKNYVEQHHQPMFERTFCIRSMENDIYLLNI